MFWLPSDGCCGQGVIVDVIVELPIIYIPNPTNLVVLEKISDLNEFFLFHQIYKPYPPVGYDVQCGGILMLIK